MLPEDDAPQANQGPHPEQIGRYRIERFLDEGGMARVYLAHDTLEDKPVALKQLKPNADDEMRQRFLAEIKINRSLDYPATIVKLYEAYPDADPPYFTMKPMVEDLAHRLDQAPGRRLGPEAILPILDDITRAVDYAHDKNVKHLDIKPANILFDKDGRARLSDFGVAYQQAVPEYDDDTFVRQPEFQPAGTLDYMSREQLLGLNVSSASDIFSLGVVLFEMLSGTPPFSGDLRHQIDHRADDTWIQQRITSSQATRKYASVLSRVLSRDPARRHKNAHALYIEFERAVQGIADKPQRWPVWLPWALLGLIAFAVLALIFRPQPQPQPTPRPPVFVTAPLAPGDSTATPAGATTLPTPPPPATETGGTAPPAASETPAPPTVPPASPSPAPPATIAVQAGPLVETTARARVRTGPGLLYDVLTVLVRGVQAAVLGRATTDDGEWYNIELEDGRRGWVSAVVVLLTGALPADVPVAATIPAPPTPTSGGPPPASSPTSTPGGPPPPPEPTSVPKATDTPIPEGPTPTDTPIPEGY